MPRARFRDGRRQSTIGREWIRNEWSHYWHGLLRLCDGDDAWLSFRLQRRMKFSWRLGWNAIRARRWLDGTTRLWSIANEVQLTVNEKRSSCSVLLLVCWGDSVDIDAQRYSGPVIRSVVICTNWSMNLSSDMFKLLIEAVSTTVGLEAIHSIKLMRFSSPDISSKARINCDPVTPCCINRDRTWHRICWRWFLMHRNPVSDDWSVRGMPCSRFPFALDKHIGGEDLFCSSFDARNSWSRTRCWKIRYRCWAIIAERMNAQRERKG